ncbi:MAG TPA: S49 family peptidase [Thermomicrobiaceae bacterium]|nr:S49 family peptidase [Thermomicrobiaceae bacterium]
MDTDEMKETSARLPVCVLRTVAETPWAILPAKFAEILAFLDLRSQGVVFSHEQIQARVSAASPRAVQAAGSVAILPLYGTIGQRMNLMSEFSGGTSTEQFATAFRQALADDSVGSIVIDVDSPGGTISGVPELASEIQAARGQKPIVAVANSLAASAAYWIASQADELVVTPSGEVGSIGVFAAHQDVSEMLANLGTRVSLISAGKFKTEGNPYEPLSDDARAAIQASVDDYYQMFATAVAKGRGVSKGDVTGGFGEGRIVGAKQALSLGMADRVATLRETIARLASGGRSTRSARAEEVKPELVAGDVDRRRRRLRLLAQS